MKQGDDENTTQLMILSLQGVTHKRVNESVGGVALYFECKENVAQVKVDPQRTKTELKFVLTRTSCYEVAVGQRVCAF